MTPESAKFPIGRSTAIVAVVLIAIVGFVLGVTGVPKGVAIGVTALLVAIAVAILVPRWMRQQKSVIGTGGPSDAPGHLHGKGLRVNKKRYARIIIFLSGALVAIGGLFGILGSGLAQKTGMALLAAGCAGVVIGLVSRN
ncbi:hypothetical protein [Micromonospora sp. RTGN7]|uniref:hypothetical protein n=1 Tax=Micromonospora sp. RTGN7 TaxID=3016526 RepID=UPI0029FF4BCB|nr:hypothetical protein [Micromonospora sp. RTGN7]